MVNLRYFVGNVEYCKNEFDSFYQKIFDNSTRQKIMTFYQNAKLVNGESESNVALVLKVDGISFYILGREEELKRIIKYY